MIISYYGKKFLNKFNEVENKHLTPKEFFIENFYLTFFGGKKSLVHIQNSPFSNPSLSKKPVGEKLALFLDKIKKKEYGSEMFVGGFVSDLSLTTSCNVSINYNNIIDEDEIYYSWIGHALSIHMGHGINFLFGDENILYDVYLGWGRYSELLSNPLYDKYKGNQISTWNMLWINDQYNVMGKTPKFNPFDQNKDDLKSISWVRFLFNLTAKYPNQTMDVYAYNFGQTNKTYGNVRIELKKIDSFLKFCSTYFTDSNFLNKPELYEAIFGTGYSMSKICEFGSIGVSTLKPELFKLEEITHKSQEVQKKINNHFKLMSENNNIYKLYNLYLMAILNLKEIEGDVIEIAKSLSNFQYDTRKNEGKQLVEKLLSSENINTFLKQITEMMKICESEKLISHSTILNNLLQLAISDETKLSNLLLLIKFNFYKINLEKKS